jgi:oligopeptide/dipeptide ABC transporter ATP-binding protein
VSAVEPLLEVRDLAVWFATREGEARAVEGASFTIGRGEIVGLMGESGSGKSVTAQAILRLVAAGGRIVEGAIRFEGRDLLALPPERMREVRGREIALVFQDPASALDPVMRVGRQIAESLVAHGLASRDEALQRAILCARSVGLADAQRALASHPHQLSGGMRQRAALAQALVCEPKLVLADEITTALDATLAVKIREIAKQTSRERGASWLWITHDLRGAREVCDRVLVMYAGRIVESAPTSELFAHPRHPYTRALLRSELESAQPRAELATIPGQPPSATRHPSGCAFRTRCELAVEHCATWPPRTEPVAPGHDVACHRVEDTAP